MERRTLLLDLIAMLALLSGTEAGLSPIENFGCQWQTCRDRLVCGFDQLGPVTKWQVIQSNLTLDDAATVRCQLAGYNGTQIRCLYEGLRETKFGKISSHKFQLRLGGISQEELVEEFNQTLAQMEVPEWTTETKKNATYPLPQRPPQFKGFYHNPKKEELHIYWQPLDVWEFCSKDMWYTVNASSGNLASVVGRDFAIYSNWNPELPANLTIQSENYWGSSWSSSHLQVPILSNAQQKQPQNVFYDDAIKTIRWDAPKDSSCLVGYTVYSCLKSSTNSSWCNDREPMLTDSLETYRSGFQFGKSKSSYHLAMVADYSDGTSGGLVWSSPAPTKGIGHLVVIVGTVMLIFLAVYVLCFKMYFKIRYMAAIRVELPYFQPKEKISTISHQCSSPLEGNIAPEILGTPLKINEDGYLVMKHIQPEAHALPPVQTRGETLVVAYTVMS